MTQTGSLYLIRHGESEWNQLNRFTGWADIPLTPQGTEEMKNAAKALQGIAISAIYSSGLQRTDESARIIRDTLHLEETPLFPAPELRERFYGELQGLNKEEAARHYGSEQVHLWRRSYSERPPGGESLKEAAEGRILPFFSQVIAPHVRQGHTVLICAHGNTLRALIMHLEGIGEEAMLEFEVPNGAIYCYIPAETPTGWRGGRIYQSAA